MSQDALNLWERMHTLSRKDNQPWLDGGSAAVNDLSRLFGFSGDPSSQNYGFLSQRFGMDDFEQDPGYQYRLSEGEKALQRAQSARGNFLSGQGMKEMGRFNQDFASNEFGNARNRFYDDGNQLYSRLMGLSGQGQNAANIMTGANMNYASGAGQIYQNIEALKQAKSGLGGFGVGDALGALSSFGGMSSGSIAGKILGNAGLF